MSVQSIPVEKFQTTTTIMGISTQTMMVALMIQAPIFFLLQNFLSGIPFLVLCGVLYWYVFLKLAEYLIEIIPKNYFIHMLEWIIIGSHLCITNDGSPTPMVIVNQEELAEVREKRLKAQQLF